MSTIASFAKIASLMGDPARAAMLWALMDGRALASGELARFGGVANSTASEHLAALREAGLVTRVASGRHRYYRLTSPKVGSLLESVMGLTTVTQEQNKTERRAIQSGPRDQDLRLLRTCYDHLAGQIAVALADILVERGHLRISDDAGFLTSSGTSFLSSLGVEFTLQPERPSIASAARLCRPCLDWSERRYHIAGEVGRELHRFMVRKHWLRPGAKNRALDITPSGLIGLERYFGIRAKTANIETR